MKKIIYLDHAATTPVDPRVIKKMVPYFSKKFGNPASIHKIGREAHKAIYNSKKQIADFLKVSEGEIYFTGSASESNRKSLLGIINASKLKNKHIISTQIEHPSVLELLKMLKKDGHKITLLKVDNHGVVDVNQLQCSINKNTVLISLSHSNGEIGTIQPLIKIAKIAKEKKIVLHLDATQSIGYLPIDINKTGVDLLTFGVHKIYGPKGIGVMYVKDGIQISSEDDKYHSRKFKTGTENVPGIVGAGSTIKLLANNKNEVLRLKNLRDYFIKNVLLKIPDSILTGHPEKRHPTNASFCFKNVRAELAILLLEESNIYASSGSACKSETDDPSYVLEAMGILPSLVRGALRFTFGKTNTKKDVNCTIDVLGKVIDRIRKRTKSLRGK